MPISGVHISAAVFSKMHLRPTTCLIYIFVCALFHRGSCTTDVFLTCPSTWVDGQTVTLTCDVLISRWAQPNPCIDSYSGLLDFIIQPYGGSGSSACTVNGETNCDGTTNSQGCGCRRNTTHYNFHYTFVANKIRLSKSSFNCQPDCLTTSTSPPSNPLMRGISKTCSFVVFQSPCDNNACRTGSCSVNKAEPQCSCDGTYYKGQRCGDDPCAGAGARTCYALKSNDNKRQCLTGFSGDKCEACGFGDCGETCKCTGLIVFLVMVVVIGTNSLNAFVTLARAKMVQLRPRPKGSRYEADARQEEPAHAQYQDGKATIGGKLVNQDEPSTVADDSSQVSSLESETDTAHDKDGKGNYGKK